jgi:hypothetical protein
MHFPSSRLSRSILLLLGTGLLLTGCKSSGGPGAADSGSGMSPSAMSMAPGKAIMCDKCQTVWIKSPQLNDKGRPAAFQYTYKTGQTCPDCEKNVQAYLDAGNPPGGCKTCGGTMQICDPSKM